jgi:hypothetical protein
MSRYRLRFPRAWSAKGRQNFGTIANYDAASSGVRQIRRDVSAGA